MNARLQTQPKAAPPLSHTPVHTNLLQRKCACGGASGVTGECEDCRNKRLTLQRHATKRAEPSTVPPIVDETLRSSGQPLDQATRDFMEPRFGHDFSQVRVHTDARGAESARAVNALAYTVGDTVVFGANQYAPTTARGRELLGHELAHTIQQRNATGSPSSADSNGVLEASAEAAGRDVSHGRGVSSNLPSCGFGLSRSPDDEREAAIKEAEAYLARVEEEDKEEKEREKEEEAAAITPMSLSKRPVKPTAKPATKPPARRDKTPDRFAFGGFTDEEARKVEDEAKADLRKELDELDRKEREIRKRPYKQRLHHARSIVQSKSDKWYSAKEANADMTGEDVWREGIANDLFLEREKKFVYEDQGSIQKYYQEKIEENIKRARNKFETDKYNRHVARGKQHSAIEPFLQPFAFGAAGTLVGAAYAGVQTGLTVGEVYNACAHGTGADCAAATAKGAVTTAAVKVATRGRPGANNSSATNTAPRNSTVPPYAPASPLTKTQPMQAFDKTEPGTPPKPPGSVTQDSIPPSGGGGGGRPPRRRNETIVSSPPPMPRRPPPPRAVISWFPRRDATPMSPDDVMRVHTIDAKRIIWSFHKGNNMAEWSARGGKGLPPLAFTADGRVRIDYYRWKAMGYPDLAHPTP